MVEFEEKVYRCDPLLRVRVLTEFSDPHDQEVAWKMVGIIRDLYDKQDEQPLFTLKEEEE